MRGTLNMKTFALVALLGTAACYDTGSCFVTTTDGYNYCEDYLGTEYNQSVTKDNCTAVSGSWSAKACSHAGALGTCTVVVADTGNAQNVLYTYYVSSSGAAATAANVETACGLVGGAFSAE